MVRGSPNPLHFGLVARLKRARKEAQIPPTTLSRAAGLAAQTVANIENGNMPSIDAVERLARTLGMSVCALAYGQQVDAPIDEGGFIPDSPLRCRGMGERLEQTRKARGLTKRDLGKAAGTSDMTIGNIERGVTLCGIDVAERIAQALDVSPCWLAFGEGDPSATWPWIKRPRKPKTSAPRTARRKGR